VPAGMIAFEKAVLMNHGSARASGDEGLATLPGSVRYLRRSRALALMALSMLHPFENSVGAGLAVYQCRCQALACRKVCATSVSIERRALWPAAGISTVGEVGVHDVR